MFDIIGDIHGYDEALVSLLTKMGYGEIDGVWQHPTRILISVGDLVDRGPGQRKVVDILKTMHKHGKAKVVMGNHEFYAVAWHAKDEKGQPLRPHTEKNYKEHQAFLEQADYGSPWYLEAINWFATLPLYIETPDMRCVHASWCDNKIAVLNEFLEPGAVLPSELWQSPRTFDIAFYKALEYTVNGPKLTLPEGYTFTDSAGKVRKKVRLKWWDLPDTPTYRNATTSVPNPLELPNIPIELSSLPSIKSTKPIFFGHYWMQGTPVLMKNNIACLDWSIVQESGVLAAYRFDGEQTLDDSKLVWV